ncbi:MAG: N-acetylmuramoyl-L-alanine amidase, partial [Anaerolineae bacterium]
FDSLAGIQTDAPSAPGKPWWEAGSYYFTQKMGMAAADNDVVARPVYARWEHAGTGDDAVFVSWHTNGWTGSAQTLLSGTETYVHNGVGLPRTEGSLELRDAIHSEVVHDIRGAWDPSWDDRGQREANYGELRLLWDANPATRMPGVLIEIGYHDNPDDTDALREPSFNQLVARAIYQGIVKYFDPGGALLPEPPTRLRVENVAGGDVRVSWRASQTDGEGLGGGPATGYRVYTSGNGIGWSNGIPVSGATEMTLTDVAPGELLFVRVTATNGGGESFPTETLAVRGGDAANLLLVNGFDRLNRTMEIRETDPVEGLNARMIQDRMNRYDYVIQHGEAIPYALDSATNGAVRSGTVDLTDYSIVDWILGEESGGDEAFADAEQSLVKTYLDGGGALFVSGSEVAWDLDLMGDTGDRQFYRDYLRARYDSDDAGTYEVKGVNGTFVGLSFRFDEPGMYDADYPDRLTPNGSTGVLAYGSDGGQGTAGVQYASGCERVVNFGFPFETIRTAQTRNDVMAAVLEFLGLNRRLPDTLIVSPSDGSGHAETPAFDGTADAQCGTLDRVDVLIEQSSSGRYWNGASWGTTATWLVASGTEAWSYPLPTSLADGDYHLWARAWAEGVPDESPAAVMFTHDTVAPATPSLIAPTDGAEISALPQLVLDWTDVSDSGSPVSYRVQLDGQMFDATSSEYARHVADGFHQWRVQAEDAAENVSGWTEQWSFLVSRLHAWLPLVLRGSGEPSPECSDVIVNGGFEWDGGWALNNLAIYQTGQVHSGAQSARVGIPPGDPDSYSYSSVSQEVTLPTGSSATLRMWVYPISENNDPGDLHYVWLHDESGGSHPLDTTTTDSREWTYREYPGLTDFLGQAVTISIGAKNDGDGDTAALYIDDVQLEVCP